jgi:hypothetical protein
MSRQPSTGGDGPPKSARQDLVVGLARAPAQEGQDGRLVHPGAAARAPRRDLLARQVPVEDRGVDVALAADGDRVAQAARHLRDGGHHVSLARRGRRRRDQGGERPRRQHRPRERSEVLGAEDLALGIRGGQAYVLVDVVRAHSLAAAPLVEVLKQLVAGHVPATPNDARQPGIGQLDLVRLAALAPKVKPQPGPRDVDVAVAQRRQAVVLVGADVFAVPHADQRALEQPHHRGDHLLAGEARARQVGLHPRAQSGQHAAEDEHPVVLRLVALGAPRRVVPVLAPPARVAANRLDVAVGVGADPHLPPGGRDRQAANAREGRVIADGPARGAHVHEPGARAAADDTGASQTNVA